MLSSSEIFNNYTKIAKQEGLIDDTIISTASEESADSDILKTIELLYGVKPNKDNKNRNIVEEAHPESCVIAPSYDRLNGLVENENQRHDIIMMILNKPPQAKLTQQRYAADNLLQELISLGYFMENQDHPEIAILADQCSAQLQKQAILPLLGVIAGGLALISIYNNFAYLSQGVENDCDNTVEALQKFASQASDIETPLKELISGINYVKGLHKEAAEQASVLQNKHQISDVVKLQQSSVGEKAFDLLEKYKRAASVLSDRILKIYLPLIQSFEPTSERSSSPAWAGLMGAWTALFGSAKNDAVKALVGANLSVIGEGGLVGSLKNSVQQITAKETAMKAYVDQHGDKLLDLLSSDKETTESTKDNNVKPTEGSKAVNPSTEPKHKSLLEELQESLWKK